MLRSFQMPTRVHGIQIWRNGFRTSARFRRPVLLLLLGLLSSWDTVHAQSGEVTLRGRVLDVTGAPLSGATVSVNAFDLRETQAAQTALDGRYRVVMRNGARELYVTVGASGFASQTRQVTVPATDSIVVLPDIRLARSARALPAVRVVAPRAPPVRAGARNSGQPGQELQTIDASSGFATAITGDVTGDLQAALRAIPGVAVTTAGSGVSEYTIAGLDATQNRVTLNGADATPAAPRDGGVLRVTTSSYDPAESMSGVHEQWVMLGGSYLTTRKLRLTFDPFVLHGGLQSTVTARPNAPVLSGAIAGPIGHVIRFHNTAFQVSRSATSLKTLAGLDDAALAAIGLVPNSARLLLGALDSLGLVTSNPAPEADQTSTHASLYTRLDFTKESTGMILTTPAGQVSTASDLGDGRILYLILGGDASSSRFGGTGPLTLSSHGVTSSQHNILAQLFHSIYLRRYLLNETRLSASIGRSLWRPVSRIPAASILTSDADATGGNGILSVQAGGSGDATSTGRSWSVQLMNETRWPSRSGRHEWKVAFESLFDRLAERRGASEGRFEFSSIEGFIASRPTAFSRTLSTSSTSVRGVHLGLGVGDSYSSSRSLAWQFGVRAEGHGLVADDAVNQRADSVFGVRTGVLPMRFSIAPMAGFTWKYRKNRSGYPDNYHMVLGGIRDYRASMSTRSAEGVFGGGLGRGGRQLRCVDAAAPKPEWARYEASEAAIPTGCAEAAADSLLAQSASPVALFAPTFALAHSVRTDLQWSSPIATGLYLSIHGMTAINTNQPSTVDLNFNGAPRFLLDGEAARPVFVTPGSISAGSGTAATIESRRDSAFSSVNERRTDLRSRASSITTSLAFRPAMARFESGIRLPLNVSYTWFDTREQRNGFTGTTAGDPRFAEWQPAAVGRHAVIMSAALHVPDWFRLTAGLQWRSGAPYTPTVLGDVNADGIATNDRAFVIDPAQTSDSVLRDGMARLLVSAPPTAQRCIRSQLGAVARANSCTGPSSSTLNAVVTIDPARVRLQNRGAIQIRLTNVLAGLDQLAHGADRVHGWGQSVYPDPVLLRVAGFDPVARRYRYDVNRSFGDPRPFQRFFYSPFRVAIEVAIDIGPDREQLELDRRLSPPSRGGTVRADSAVVAEQLRRAHDPRNLFEPVLRRADEFQLTDSQRDSLKSLGHRHAAFRDSAYAALASFVASRDAKLTDEEVRRNWRESLRAVARFEWQIGAMARQILTPAQAAQVFDRNGPLGPRPIVFDAHELERYLKLWQERVF